MGALDGGDLRPGDNLVQELAGPGKDGPLRGVVVGVLGDEASRGRSRADRRVGEPDLLRAGEADGCARLRTGEVEVVDVDRLPLIGERELAVIDGVVLVQAKAGCGELEPATGVPVETAFVAPG